MILALFSKFTGIGSRATDDDKAAERDREIIAHEGQESLEPRLGGGDLEPLQGDVRNPDLAEELVANGGGANLSAADDDDEADDEPIEEVEVPFEQEGQDFSHIHDDPLAPAFDLERGEPISRRGHDRAGQPNWKSKVQSASEFFQTEILYRFDILENPDREKVKGSYRLDLKGYKGGIWTIIIDNEMTILNRREEADAVLSMQHQDFLRIVNGELNPQLGILSQKVRASGDMRRIVAFMALLTPEGQ